MLDGGVGLGGAFITMRSTDHGVLTLDSGRVGRVLLTITSTTVGGASFVLDRGRGSLRHVPSASPGCSHLGLAGDHLRSVTTSVHGMTTLPSPLKGILGRGMLPGKLGVGEIDMPFNIVNVVCRTHPGIDFSMFSLYLGDNGTYVLGNKDSTSCSGHTVVDIVRRMLRRFGMSARVIRLLPTSERTATRLLRTGSCMSLVVPHNDDDLVGFMHRGTAMPIVRANTNMYRAFFSHCNSVDVNPSVVTGTGAHQIDMYGTLSYLVVRTSDLTGLPSLYLPLRSDGMRVFTSRPTCRDLHSGCPIRLLELTARSYCNERFLSCGVTVGAIGSFRRTLTRVQGCNSGRDRYVVASSGAHTR